VNNETVYITSLHEAIWGVVMIALTITIHGFGVVLTLIAGRALQRLHRAGDSLFHGMGILVLATSMLVLVHLLEVVVWGAFLVAKGAFPNLSIAIYYALMQYTTVSSSLRLPEDLRLLGGIIPLSGMLTVAWSTSVLFLLARPFLDRYSDSDRRL